MNLSGSSNKHPLNPKKLPIQVIQGESKGFKPRVQRKHKLPVHTCVRNMKPSSSLKIQYPAAFHFKEEKVLAAHPPSCHPRRVFGNQERKRK